MSRDTRTIKASCLCSNSAHEIILQASDYVIKGAYCHCDSCRHMTGNLYQTVGFLPAHYQPAQSLLDNLTSFAFSRRLTQYFCTNCGCQMLTRCAKDVNDPNSQVAWHVATGTLEHIDGIVEWTSHEYVQDTLDGGFSDMLVEMHGKKLQRWPTRYVEGEKELPLYWRAQPQHKVQASPDDKLHGHCKCGGVEFFIARPSARSAMAKEAWPGLPSAEISQTGMPPSEETPWLCDGGRKYTASVCVCNSCRLAFGMDATFWGSVATVDLTLDKEGKVPFNFDFGTLKKYTSSPGRHRYFCGACGATCLYESDDRPYYKDVAVGLLAAPEGARAESWFGWTTDKVDYREDAISRAEGFTMGVESGLKAWADHRKGFDMRE